MDEQHHDVQDEIHLVNYIMIRRVYDVLLGIYSNINPSEADALARLHEDGGFASPEPSISYEAPNGDVQV